MLPTPERLLRLYPRAWRERYGEEFIASVDHDAPRLPQAVDIVSGAVDAWLSTDVRTATRASGVARTTGGSMALKSVLSCDQVNARVTTRDALIGAAAMIVGEVIFTIAAKVALGAGWPVAGHVLNDMAFTGPFTLSMPLWLMKGAPRKGQVGIIGVTLALLAVIGYLQSAS